MTKRMGEALGFLFLVGVLVLVEVCRIYYPEMSRFRCYMSGKTVVVPRIK